MNYNFEWNTNKAEKNIRKHKISFENASSIFLDPNMITIYDNQHSQLEDRWITIGLSRNKIIIVLVHTYEVIDKTNVLIRIISARKATKKEIKQYRSKHL